MILVYTYVDDGKTYVDFGVESHTGKFIVLPNQELNVQKMGLLWDADSGHYYIP